MNGDTEPQTSTVYPANTAEKIKRIASTLFVKGGVLPWFLGIAVLIFGIGNENFLTENNLFGVSRQSTYLILVSIAQMLIMFTAGLDLSVGVMLALTSVVSSMTMVTLWSGNACRIGLSTYWLILSFFRFPLSRLINIDYSM